MTRIRQMLTALIFGCASIGAAFAGGVKFARPFADHMVLQRGRQVPIWGTGTPGETVNVSFAGQSVGAVVDAKGEWRVSLQPLQASKEPRVLSVVSISSEARPSRQELSDVLVGEVWICSGQSNAECPIWSRHPHYREGQGGMILQMTVKPFVRLAKSRGPASTTPAVDYPVVWTKMTPDDLGWGRRDVTYPSALGYLFALELSNALDIPVGLVDCTWGGTNIDAWTPRSGYANVPSLRDVADLPILPEAEFRAAKSNGVYRTVRHAGNYDSWIQQPGVLWNGCVAALAPMALRGFIWYQGCNNAGEPERYCDKMHALYNGWSTEFANPGLKMYFAQLAPWGVGWVKMWEAQSRFEKEEKNSAMVVLNDVGCLTDIHPRDKRTVAKRLALHALKRDYGFDWIADNSPTLASWKIDRGRFILSFHDVREWYLYNEDWSLSTGFEVAGADGVWKPAQIENVLGQEAVGKMHGACRGNVRGKDLVVFAKGVEEPVSLRYLYSKPWKGNLYNEVDLPLGAFSIEKEMNR